MGEGETFSGFLGFRDSSQSRHFREKRLGSIENRAFTCCPYDCNGYCWPSLALGNPARAEILEGDVWGALKIEHYVLPL